MNTMPRTTTIDNRVFSVEFNSNKPITFKKKSMYPTQYNNISNNARLKDICQAFITAGYAAVVKKNDIPYSPTTNLFVTTFMCMLRKSCSLRLLKNKTLS